MKTPSTPRRSKGFRLWLISIGLLTIVFGLLCFSFFHKMNAAAQDIYEHPYTVVSEARAMQSRLVDMRILVPAILMEKDTQSAATFDKNTAMQEESFEIIQTRYLGSSADVEALKKGMADIKSAESAAVVYAEQHSEAEITAYLHETLDPCYDRVNRSLSQMIGQMDEISQGMEQQITTIAYRSIGAFLLLLAFVLITTAIFWQWERKNMREIQYREMLFDSLGTNIDDVVYILNPILGKVEFISKNSAKILGFPLDPADQELKAFHPFLSPEDREKIDKLKLDMDFAEAQEIDLEVNREGEKRYIKLRIYPEKQAEKVIRYIAIISDLTKEHEITQALSDALLNAQKANAAKSNFLSRMSHEIRTPMNAIIGMTTIAATHIEDTAQVENCLSKIAGSSKHLMALINDVLDMSKIEEGKMSISKEVFSLSQLLEGISQLIFPQAKNNGIAFKIPLVDITEENLCGDILRLKQILLNLLSNAVKFTPSGGEISLEVRQMRKRHGRVEMRFRVSDTGVGMSEDFIASAFSPFSQESSTSDLNQNGTGLGLSITKNLVTLMDGSIDVKSEKGKGSVFTVDLRFDSVSEEACHSLPSAEFEEIKVLVADEDEASCEHTTLLLDKMGIVAQWVLTGTQAVDFVLEAHERGEDFDVCFINLRMPDISGIETTRRIREIVGSDLLIIIITAYDWQSLEHEARQAGANHFLSKPIFASSLYEAFRNATAKERQGKLPISPQEVTTLVGFHVLLAEDNALNQEIAVELLRLTGVTADCVNNGKEALEIFTASKPGTYSAILMDIQMPVMDGYEATRAIRHSEHPEAQTVPILAMTANAFQDDISKSLNAGMNAHIAKPIDPPHLYKILEENMVK